MEIYGGSWREGDKVGQGEGVEGGGRRGKREEEEGKG
jgi:hypothetical protein